MKRISIAAGVMLLIAFAATAVSYLIPHDVGAAQFREYRCKWIRTQVPALNDSDMICRDGSNVASAQHIDTTGWIPLWDGMEVGPGRPAAVVLADTIQTYFDLYPVSTVTNAVTTAFDTATVTIQASIDAANPVAVTKTFSNPMIETSSNNGVYQPVVLGFQSPAANGTAPTNLQLGPYRFVRFIVAGGWAGCYQAVWRYPGTSKGNSALSP